MDISWKLFEQQLTFMDKAEFARVTGLPLKWIMSRGQQIRTVSILLRTAKCYSLVLPVVSAKFKVFDEKGKEVVKAKIKYKGATVIEPIPGYYLSPVGTLDFSSLYPSIMIAWNLCYCTLIPKNLLHLLDPTEYNVFVNEKGEHYFGKQGLREGLLTKVLLMLISKRNIAKDAMEAHKGTYKASIFNGRQNALKMVANSVYGGTGTDAEESVLSEQAIGSVVTERGRVGLELTAQVTTRPFSDIPANPVETDDQYHTRVGTPEWPLPEKPDIALAERLKAAYYKGRLPETPEQHKARIAAARAEYPVPRLAGETDEAFSARILTILGFIYGDTDSIMVNANACQSAAEAIKLFTALADWISKWFFFAPMRVRLYFHFSATRVHMSMNSIAVRFPLALLHPQQHGAQFP